MLKQLIRHRVVRFAAVGLSNAALHFTVLNATFYLLDFNKIAASITATICAVTYSFFLNKSFVFRDKEGDFALVREALLFALVTLTGMLFIHNLAYAAFITFINGHEQFIIDIVNSVTSVTLSKDFVDINVATIVGALAAMLWNYNGYRFIVFKKAADSEEEDGVES